MRTGHRQKALMVMLFGAAVFGAMAMLTTAGEVEEEALVLRWLEDRRSRWWTFAMVAITRFGSGPVTAILTTLLCIWLLARKRRLDAAFLATANLGSALLNAVFKSFFERQRPPDEVVTSIMDLDTFSFPSGHALSAMVFYASVSIVGARLGGAGLRTLLLTVAALMIPTMGFTRVYLGVHYPTDVIAGWGLGAAWVSVAYLLFYAATGRR